MEEVVVVVVVVETETEDGSCVSPGEEHGLERKDPGQKKMRRCTRKHDGHSTQITKAHQVELPSH